jgi:predicted protein tyrosine phosphatase
MRMVTDPITNAVGNDEAMIVTSYWTARERAVEFDPTTIISLMDPDDSYSVPAGPSLREHIKINVHDAVSSEFTNPTRYVVPTEAHVRRIIDFASRWDGVQRTLVHCTAGVSRSPAVALVLLAARNPGHEIQIALLLRKRGPWASPNPLIVKIADKLLGRKGVLVSAFVKMGPPTMRGVPEPIFLPGIF